MKAEYSKSSGKMSGRRSQRKSRLSLIYQKASPDERSIVSQNG